jgi:dethiobiotin synthetase/adenosylmethionine--8-amino-7-oxononanoate aminotransferase
MPVPAKASVGSLLWRSLRVYQVYGANTEVGKTVFSTVLCKAARRHWPREKTAFLKPVSTGPLDEADDRCK